MWPLWGYTMGVRNRSLFIYLSPRGGGGGGDGRVKNLVISNNLIMIIESGNNQK